MLTPTFSITRLSHISKHARLPPLTSTHGFSFTFSLLSFSFGKIIFLVTKYIWMVWIIRFT